MKKLPCIKSDGVYYVLLKDYQDFFNGWVVLIITKNEIFTKADERIIGDAKMAEKTFKEIYSYKAEFSYKTIKEVV
jgi:hypothetical protein